MGNEQSSDLNPEELKAEARKDHESRKQHAKERHLAAHAARKAQKTSSRKPEPEPETLTIRSKDSSQTSEAGDILQSFQPRKQPREKLPNTSGKTSRDERQAIRQDSQLRGTKGLDTSKSSDSSAFRADSSASRGTHNVATSSCGKHASKRPAPPTTSENMLDLSTLPKIAKRTSVASPQSPTRIEDAVGGSASEPSERPPKWYLDIPVKNVRGKDGGNVEILLQSLRDNIAKCQQLRSDKEKAEREKTMGLIRDKLHKFAFLKVTGVLLRHKRMLHDNDGLPQLFDDAFSKGMEWPLDIKADAHELYNKWCRRDFATDILRGIKSGNKTAGNKKDRQKATDSIDRNYPVVSARFHGNGKLLNGQWWPIQLAALRDGAHGVTQGGISGTPGEGAYSCIMSGGHDYPDLDNGDEVQYCGTDSVDGSVTAYTQRMLESVGNHPVRLLRSHNLNSEYAPVAGFRYDGLYDVVSYEMLDPPGSKRQRHRFRLVRQPDQDPIRGGSGPERRPTEQELEAYQQHQRFAGKTK